MRINRILSIKLLLTCLGILSFLSCAKGPGEKISFYYSVIPKNNETPAVTEYEDFIRLPEDGAVQLYIKTSSWASFYLFRQTKEGSLKRIRTGNGESFKVPVDFEWFSEIFSGEKNKRLFIFLSPAPLERVEKKYRAYIRAFELYSPFNVKMDFLKKDLLGELNAPFEGEQRWRVTSEFPFLIAGEVRGDERGLYGTGKEILLSGLFYNMIEFE